MRDIHLHSTQGLIKTAIRSWNCNALWRGDDWHLVNHALFSCCACRYQDIHNQSYVMVMASGRWLGVRLDLLASLLISAVALGAVVVSQDAGEYIL